jgi:predicted nucleic acid-binding Zn ribbon protein
LGNLLAGARDAASAASGASIAPDVWRKIVGDRVADVTRAGRLRDGTLNVQTKSHVWAQELSLLSEDILERLRAAGLNVQRVRFYAQKLESMPAEAPRKAPPPPAPLPAELRARLESIEDPELRSIIAEAAAHSLARQQRTTPTQQSSTNPRSAARQSDRPGPADADSHGASPSSRGVKRD